MTGVCTAFRTTTLTKNDPTGIFASPHRGDESLGCRFDDSLYFIFCLLFAQRTCIILFSAIFAAPLSFFFLFCFFKLFFASPHPHPRPPAQPPSLRRETSRFCPTLSPSSLRWKGGWNDGCSHGREAEGQFIYIRKGRASLGGKAAACVSLFTFADPLLLLRWQKFIKNKKSDEGGRRGVDLRRGWNREANLGKEE